MLVIAQPRGTEDRVLENISAGIRVAVTDRSNSVELRPINILPHSQFKY